MEGRAWRGVLALVCLLTLASGCGNNPDTDDLGDVVATAAPEIAFAPMIHLARDERYLPMSARWFIGRSTLWMSYGSMCPPGRIAVGRLLAAQRTKVTDWIYIPRLGWGRGYWREPYADAACDHWRKGRAYANQLTRPRDESPERAAGLYPDEGYYLDLEDWGRGGRPTAVSGKRTVVDGVDVWYERRPVRLSDGPGLRIGYWMLYGMSRPADGEGQTVAELTHEGDWERLEVTLLANGEKNSWVPRAVRLMDLNGRWRELPWRDVRRVAGPGSRSPTHPVLFAARGSHALYARPGRHVRRFDANGKRIEVVDVVAAPCGACPRWSTWQGLSEVRMRDWYTFGGAWGELGPTSFTTGPLGPHGRWAKPDPLAQTERMKTRPRLGR